MKLCIVLFSIFGAIFAAPSGTYYYAAPAYPATTPIPAPPAPQPPAAPPATYTKTYYTTPVQYVQPATYASYYNAVPLKPSVTGTLQSFQDTYGAYNFQFAQSDGQNKEESKSADGGVSGQYSYVNPDGEKVEISYTAGKDGFRAIGSHLPVGPVGPAVPELPEELAQAYQEAYSRLEKAHEEARARPQTYDDGSYKPEPESVPVAPAAPQIVYKTYAAAPAVYAYPAKSYTYVAPPAPAPAPAYTYVAPAAPAPAAPEVKPVYTTSSYSTNVGGEIKPAPAPAAVPVHYQAAPLKVKSAYEGKPY